MLTLADREEISRGRRPAPRWGSVCAGPRCRDGCLAICCGLGSWRRRRCCV